jgi:catechol 2,3-dioxygenase-like lactoylglutathione lyase family enzyme
MGWSFLFKWKMIMHAKSQTTKTINNFELCCLSVFFLLCGLQGKAQPERPPLTGIAFVELQVTELEKSTGFYSGLLGYRAAALPASVNKGHWIYFSINAAQSIRIKDGLPAGQDERLLSIAFQTTDAEALRRYLQSKMVAVPASVNKEPNGDLWFQVTDPDGHIIKFIQYAPGRKTITALSQEGVSARILHAGITVADTAASNAFYRDILGFSEIWRGGATDSVTSWINMHVPESTAYLEYMLVNRPVNRQQLGSLHHIALMVPDMQQALETLQRRASATGYAMPSPRVGRNKRWQLNLFDPDGTRIELMEPFTMR